MTGGPPEVRDRVVRGPNHLGDLVMALGALRASPDDLVLTSGLVPLARMAALPGRILPFERGRSGWLRMVRALRGGRYRRGVLLSASFSAALLFRAGGIRNLRGTATDGRSLLLAERVDPRSFHGLHRINHYRILLGLPLLETLVSDRLTPPEQEVDRWREALGVASGGPLVALFPGSNAPARRWPADRFRALAAALSGDGVRVAVLGGPGERALTRSVAEGLPGVHDLGGRTGLEGLAAVLSLASLLVTNDTGPMHLAGAVGTRTLSLWGSSSPGEVQPVGSEDARVQGEPIPCAPCRKNDCARSGPGTILPEARYECMRLIPLEAVRSRAGELLS